MALIGELRFLERLQFFNGQRLFASDLQSLEADNRERRWLHNASLHQPGVGSGYAVAGNKGDREVTITPGYAVDAFGREIILTETFVFPLPPVANDGAGKSAFYDLAVSYPDDEALEETELREGICLPKGVVRLREQPVFCWVRLKADKQPFETRLKVQMESGLRVRLARIEVFDCKLNNAVSTAERRNARPPRQPYIACGTLSPDPETWKEWQIALGFEITVDTSAAGYVTPPCYSAHLVGDRFFRRDAHPSFDDIFKEIDKDAFLLDGFTSIFEPQATSFTLRLLLPEVFINTDFSVNPRELWLSAAFATNFTGLLKENGWQVVWLGVEN